MPISSLSRAIKIFFSYAISAPQDKRLFEKLITHLSVLRRQHLIDEWYDSAISAGSHLTQSIETLMDTADIIILLISADFFASDRCYDLEMKRAVALSETGTVHLIPVILSPTDWKIAPLNKYLPLPPDGMPVSLARNRDVALLEVARGIRQVVEDLFSKARQPQTHSMPPPFLSANIPNRNNRFFTDRDATFAAIATAFTTSPNSQTSILALNGLGGMGKSQVALEYIKRSSKVYQTTLWLNASSRSVLNMEVDKLADQLNLPQKDRKDELLLFMAIKCWLQNQRAWLLVLDQIEDVTLIDLLVPSESDGNVLLTTRIQALGGFASAIPITSMEVDCSTLFLLHRAGLMPPGTCFEEIPAAMQQEAQTIAQLMDGLPLALDQAGAYIEETGCSLTTYLTLYHEQRASLLSQRGQIVDSRDHPESVTSTLALAFEQVKKKRTANLELLYLLAFLQPDAIPDELLTDGATELDEPLQSLVAQRLTLYQTLADLRSFSLIHHGADRTILCIHRIVQATLTDALSIPQQRYWATLVVRMVNCVFPEIRFDTRIACQRYLPQAQHCAILIAKYQLTLREGPLLLERLGTYCYRQACYGEAETYLTQALQLQHEHHDIPEALEAAQTLNALGLLYSRQARYEEAEALHQRALTIRERLLGPAHPKTAESLHNLAVLYGNLGQYEQAEQFYLRVLLLDENMSGTTHPDTAKTLNNLGLIYYLQANYPQAETAYLRALAIYEKALPADHPDVTYSLNSLGTLYEKQGKYEKAEELYQRTLTMREQIFGDKHPETAHSMNKLADVFESQGKYQQAEKLYEQALSIMEQALGPDHPDVALLLNNLAFLASKQGQTQRAEPLYHRALKIYAQTLGLDHPATISVLNNISKLGSNTTNA